MTKKPADERGPEQSGPETAAMQLSEDEASRLWDDICQRGAFYEAGPTGNLTVDVVDALALQGEYIDEARDAGVAVVVALAELKILFDRGWKIAHLLAIEYAAGFSLPAPTWATIALGDSLHRWNSAESKTLGEAFGIERPKNWNQAAAKAEAESLFAVLEATEKLRSEGAKMDQELWERVEEKTGVGAATAKRWWYRNRRPKSFSQDSRER